MLENCEHLGCGFNNRMDYCAIEASDREGDALVITDVIDSLIYEVDRENFISPNIINNSEESVAQRQICFINGPEDPGQVALQTKISLRHLQKKHGSMQHYSVEVRWGVVGSSWNQSFSRVYTIDVYAEGDVQATIEQPNLLSGQRELELMTPYDYSCLFDDLRAAIEINNIQ